MWSTTSIFGSFVYWQNFFRNSVEKCLSYWKIWKFRKLIEFEESYNRFGAVYQDFRVVCLRYAVTSCKTKEIKNFHAIIAKNSRIWDLSDTKIFTNCYLRADFIILYFIWIKTSKNANFPVDQITGKCSGSN